MQGTLPGGTQEEIQDRKGRGSSDERPHGRDEISSCHRPKAHCRVVQGAVRQAKAEHTPPHAAAKERKRNEVITVYIHRKQQKYCLFKNCKQYFCCISSMILSFCPYFLSSKMYICFSELSSNSPSVKSPNLWIILNPICLRYESNSWGKNNLMSIFWTE